MDLSTRFLDGVHAEFPRFRIVPKSESTFCSVLDVALRIVTLGGQRSFMTRYHTVIGSTLYVPPSWDSMSDVDRVILLRHEVVHLRQGKRLGAVPMALLYLFPIFPLGLAIGRARLEWEAYEETIRATAEHHGIDRARLLKPWIVARFVGPDYGWMWPFPRAIERWFDRAIAALAPGPPGSVKGS